MNVAIYARYSTDRQDGTSIAGQVENCKVLAENEGLNVVATFSDEGVSGNDDSRPEYQEMLHQLKNKDFDGIVADETSRITRNLSQLSALFDDLEFRDQFLLTVDGIDSRNESGQMIVAVQAAMDRMEGRKIANRVYRSNRERHNQGYSTGGRIYGYESVQDGNYKRRIVVRDQADVVREIYERYAEGEGPKSIARDYNVRGIPSPGSLWSPKSRRCQGWTHTSLVGSYTKASGILRNPIYTGRVVWNKRKNKKVPRTSRRIQNLRSQDDWIVYEDESLRIMSDELFDRVQSRLADIRRRHKKNTGGRPARYLFSGLLKCASCGGSYSVANGRYYRCSSQTNGRDTFCEQKKGIDKGRTDTELLTDIKSQLLDPELVKVVTKRIRKEVSRSMAPKGPSAAAKLTELDEQIANVVDSLATMGKSAALTAKLKELEHKRQGVAVSTADSPPEPTTLINAADIWTKIVSNLEILHKVARQDQVDEAREALQGIIGEVTIVEEGDNIVAYPEISHNAVYRVVPRRGLEPPRGYPH